MDWIPSHSNSVKILIIGEKVCWQCPATLQLKQTFPPIIWIFIKGDGFESRVPFKVFSTLLTKIEMIRIANKIKKTSKIQNWGCKKGLTTFAASSSLARVQNLKKVLWWILHFSFTTFFVLSNYFAIDIQ